MDTKPGKQMIGVGRKRKSGQVAISEGVYISRCQQASLQLSMVVRSAAWRFICLPFFSLRVT